MLKWMDNLNAFSVGLPMLLLGGLVLAIFAVAFALHELGVIR